MDCRELFEKLSVLVPLVYARNNDFSRYQTNLTDFAYSFHSNYYTIHWGKYVNEFKICGNIEYENFRLEGRDIFPFPQYEEHFFSRDLVRGRLSALYCVLYLISISCASLDRLAGDNLLPVLRVYGRGSVQDRKILKYLVSEAVQRHIDYVCGVNLWYD